MVPWTLSMWCTIGWPLEPTTMCQLVPLQVTVGQPTGMP
jgi:hypothetical protein